MSGKNTAIEKTEKNNVKISAEGVKDRAMDREKNEMLTMWFTTLKESYNGEGRVENN